MKRLLTHCWRQRGLMEMTPWWKRLWESPLISGVGVLRNVWRWLQNLLKEKTPMVGPAELADFELVVPEQAVDSIWKSGDVVMHEVLEAGDGTEWSSLGVRHLERVRSAEIGDVSAEDSGNGVDEGYGGRVVYLYPGTSNAAR